MLHCAITGVVPEDPVVSKSTGRIFERRVVEKHIDAHGTDPFTNAPLAKDDLISIQTKKAVPPRPLSAASIPGMLQLFQNEWDAVMLESFKLKQQLDSARQELSQTLYQHDAACRVIARLTKERDEARAAFAQLKAQAGARQSSDDMEVDSQPAASSSASGSGSATAPSSNAAGGLDAALVAKLIEHSKSLSEQRKQRKVPPTLASPEELQKFTELSSHPTHSSAHPGILCLALHPSQPHQVLTGGVDHNVVLFDAAEKQVSATIKGHTKKVVDVAFHPTEDLFFSASADKTCRVWAPSGSRRGSGYRTQYHVKDHAAPLVGVTLQATGKYFVTASEDNTWIFHDLEAATAMATIASPQLEGTFTRARFHPDGLILGTPTTVGVIRIWDIKSQKNVFNFPDKHEGVVADLAFSENGFHLASVGADDRLLKLWDLRKGAVFSSATVDEEEAGSGICVEFDYSGSYLAVGSGRDVKVYSTKSTDTLVTLSGHTAAVTDVQFGPDAKFIASTSMDRSLKFFGGASPSKP